MSLGGQSIGRPGLLYLSREFKSLEDLVLPNSMGLTDSDLGLISELSNLRRLFAGGNSNGPISDEGLRYVSRLRHLEELDIAGGGITATGIAYLAEIPCLKRFHLLSDSLNDDVLTNIATMRSLAELHLSDGRALTDTALSHLSKMENLESLKIRGAFTDEGLRYLERLKKLQSVTVTTTKHVTPGAIASLKRNLPNLRALNIR